MGVFQMAFRIKSEARDWFKYIRGKMDWDFDCYYLCLMAGLAERRKIDAVQSETIELTQDFPAEYRSRGRIIVALFINTELEEMGISLKERAGLIDPHSASSLSNEGEREINKYANGGYEVLTEWFEDKPRTLEAFLPLYKKKLDLSLKRAN